VEIEDDVEWEVEEILSQFVDAFLHLILDLPEGGRTCILVLSYITPHALKLYPSLRRILDIIMRVVNMLMTTIHHIGGGDLYY
jgi:hypothetical protein